MADQELETDEELIEMGPQKVLGRMEGDSIKAHPLSVSAQISTRQAHSGQTELVSVEFARRVQLEQVGEALRGFRSAPQALHLPSAPARPIVFHEEGRRFDSGLNSAAGEHHMTVRVERLRRCRGSQAIGVDPGQKRVEIGACERPLERRRCPLIVCTER
jgi:aspartate-semialdehyde dehydrogenase